LKAKTLQGNHENCQKKISPGVNPQGMTVKSREQGIFGYLGGQSLLIISLGVSPLRKKKDEANFFTTGYVYSQELMTAKDIVRPTKNICFIEGR
jgi:hypothetical protein